MFEKLILISVISVLKTIFSSPTETRSPSNVYTSFIGLNNLTFINSPIESSKCLKDLSFLSIPGLETIISNEPFS